ncbi:MAG: NAD-dependent epimerase/dehydratase family protein [Actinomycetota bacterium]|nr:NAD-dependent epimerase/dehydratase family protein [Actinomycetota bacterium]
MLGYHVAMRVVVVGATGNVGTSLLRSLADEPAVDSILGVSRRRPELEFEKTEWAEADIADTDLVPLFRVADAVVHLAWVIQPSRDLRHLWRINVDGSTRVFRAVAQAKVPALVYASSVGAYSPGPKDRAVDESWPTGGISSSFYARHKAEVERRLDRFQREHPGTRVVRLRTALIFKREAASGIRRLFAGPFLLNPLVRPSLLPFVPDIPGLRFQAVHSFDVGDAYRLALVKDVRGAFNVAAEPVLDPQELARALGARPVRLGRGVARGLAAVTWRLHLQPTPVGWVDMALGVPILDWTRAREELGWTPSRSATDALLELLDGLRSGAGIATPPLAPETGGPARARELLTGVGEKESL